VPSSYNCDTLLIGVVIGKHIVANRPAPETDLNADFTYVDGYDTPEITQPLNVRRTSQPKLFSLFRSKKSAEPGSVQPMQTTITAGSYSGPKIPHQSSISRRDHNSPPQYPSYQQGSPQYLSNQQGLPQLLVTAPSRPDTADYTEADSARGGDSRWQNPGQTMNAVDHAQTQPTYGRGGGGSGAFVANGSQSWAPSHQQNTEFEGFQPQNYSAAQNSPPFAGSNGWSSAMQHHEGSPRRSPRLGGPQRSFDDHWAADGERTAATVEGVGWERRKSLPSIVKLPAPATPTTQTKQRANNTSNTTSTSTVPPQRPQVDTYVIENGVRKKVRFVTMEQTDNDNDMEEHLIEVHYSRRPFDCLTVQEGG